MCQICHIIPIPDVHPEQTALSAGSSSSDEPKPASTMVVLLVCSKCGSGLGDHLMNDDHIPEAHEFTMTSAIQPAIDPEKEAMNFLDHYYLTFDTNRPGLALFYRDNSMFTFEGLKIMGAQNIIAKLNVLDPFQQYFKHHVLTVDCQPSGPGGDMLVFVTGQILLPGEQHGRKFSTMLHLVRIPQAISFYVQNDIFRLMA